MNKSMMLVASTAFIAAAAAFGQDVPDPNPVPNADGTFTWYTGRNLQWTPSQALLACGAGDDVVIVGGSYVESLSIATADVTVRCAVDGHTAAVPVWETVTLINPTQGPEANNASAVSVSASNVTVGRPNLMTELANGNITVTRVPSSGTSHEYTSDAILTPICPLGTATQNYFPFGDTTATVRTVDNSGDPNWNADQGSTFAFPGGSPFTVVQKSALQMGWSGPGAAGPPFVPAPLAMRIMSRSVDKSAIISDNCAANFNCIDITTQSGFGGGVQCLGAENTSIFNSCAISGTLSSGQDNAGNPVHAVYVGAGAPMFNSCTIQGNSGGINGVVRLAGGDASFNSCLFGGTAAAFQNMSPTSNGIVTMSSTGSFHGCSFEGNTSRLGTIYLDSTGMASSDYVKVSGCSFALNSTADGQWGAIAFCTDAVAGRSPMFVLDRCDLQNYQATGSMQGSTALQHDIVSNYFPRFRMGADSTANVASMAPGQGTGAGVANAEGEGDAPSGNPADVNGDGVVDGADLAAVLGSWG